MLIRSLLLFFFFLSIATDTDGAEPVDLELLLAIDTSTSVDSAEFDLQKQGLADAFLHPDVIGAIEGAGDRGVAVSVVQWSSTGLQTTVVDWMLVRDATGASLLSRRIAGTSRMLEGMTDIGSLIRFAVRSIEQSPFDANRRVVDISGDGSSDSLSSSRERDRAVARGIDINGLVIFNEDYDLGSLAKLDVWEHYTNHVVGGPGAFVMTAADFNHFRTAIRKKLVREIQGPATATLPRTLQ